MITLKRLFLAAVFIAVMGVSAYAVATSTTPSEQQVALMQAARAYLDDGIYVFARPLLEDAADISGEYTWEAQVLLKQTLLELGEHRNYVILLERMLASPNATPQLFLDAAEYFVSRRRTSDMFDVLRNGVARFDADTYGYQALEDFYESIRYAFELGRNAYDDVILTHEGFIQVSRDGMWGLATHTGVSRIPLMYDRISTFSQGRAIAILDDVVHAVNLSNNRLALLHTSAENIGNLSANRIPLQRNGAWVWAAGDLQTGQREYEALGMYSGGYAAAKVEGQWGLIDINQNTIIEFEHDGIVMDELGRAFAQNVVFIRERGGVTMFINNQRTDIRFEDARAFNAEGYGAVKQNGLWGFINPLGEVVIEPQFVNARSFSGHLAAVNVDNYWGYISTRGEIVIEPRFLDARDFYRGSAPVLTAQNWRFITLLEYRRRA